MNHQQENAESILFDYETTNRTAFREQNVTPVDATPYKEQQHLTNTEIKKPDVKYVYTMTSWKNNPVPFDIMFERKQIIRTNPHETIPTVSGNLHNEEQEEVRRTRPRLVMTPAVSIDDVDDKTRKVILKDIYSTHNMRDYDNRGTLSSTKSPLLGKYAPALPTVLRKYRPYYVSPEWRMQSVTWDRRQYRGHCETTKNFWLSKST